MHSNIDVHSRRLIAEFPVDGIKFIENLQSHCFNMTFYDKIRYYRTFQQVRHKRGESEMNYIKRFQNVQDLSLSVGNTYPEDQLIHTFLDNFSEGRKYSSQIASYQADLRREGRLTDQKYFSISSLHNDYLNIDSILGCGRNSERINSVQKNALFVEVLIILQFIFQKDQKGK